MRWLPVPPISKLPPTAMCPNHSVVPLSYRITFAPGTPNDKPRATIVPPNVLVLEDEPDNQKQNVKKKKK